MWGSGHLGHEGGALVKGSRPNARDGIEALILTVGGVHVCSLYFLKIIIP